VAKESVGKLQPEGSGQRLNVQMDDQQDISKENSTPGLQLSLTGTSYFFWVTGSFALTRAGLDHFNLFSCVYI